MNINEQRTKNYFSMNAKSFDAFYSRQKDLFTKMFDGYLRPDMQERYDLTMKYSGDVTGKTILDMGCGTGRYSIEFAKRGATKVVGVDFAEGMIKYAETMAKECDVGDICEFKAENIYEYESDKCFDVVIAMGVFDYIESPSNLLRKMSNLSKQKVIASYPSYSLIRTPIRKIRYRFKNCPVYFYTEQRIECILAEAGLSNYEIYKIKGCGMDYFLYVNV